MVDRYDSSQNGDDARSDVEGQRLSDRFLHCQQCGTEFIFTASEQREQARRGELHAQPQLCPACRVLGGPGAKPRGTVKWFDPRKGYGFISRAEAEDIFVHRSGLAEETERLTEGQLVAFDVEVNRGRPQAVNVEVVEA